jgi:hypothetical protein
MKRIVSIALLAILVPPGLFAGRFGDVEVNVRRPGGTDGSQASSNRQASGQKFETIAEFRAWLANRKTGLLAFRQKPETDRVITANLDLATTLEDLCFLAQKTTNEALRAILVKRAVPLATTPEEAIEAAELLNPGSISDDSARKAFDSVISKWAKENARDIRDLIELARCTKTGPRDYFALRATILEAGVRFVHTQEDADALLGAQTYKNQQADLIRSLQRRIKSANLTGIVLPPPPEFSPLRKH